MRAESSLPGTIGNRTLHRESAAPTGLHDHIDALIEADPMIATAMVWQRLAGEYGITVA